MRRLLPCVGIALAIANTATAQASELAGELWGIELTPRQFVDVRDSSPSTLTGNVFNGVIGQVTPNATYRVNQVVQLPSTAGSQFWVELIHSSGTNAAPCGNGANGCWALLGTAGRGANITAVEFIQNSEFEM